MKITKTLLTVTAAIAFTSLSALAGENQLCHISNNHGQSVPAYRSTETTVAVSSNGAGAGGNTASSSNCACQLSSKDNAHGQQVQMYR